MKFLITLFFVSALLISTMGISYSQTSAEPSTEIDAEIEAKIAQALERQEAAVVQLRDIQTSLSVKVAERRELRIKLKTADKRTVEDLEAQLEELNSDIDLLDRTFEQIAIGGIDLSVFGVKNDKFDWQEELITVVKPLIENVKSLTEKPRKIESLRRVISDKELAKIASVEALKSIQQLIDGADSPSVTQKLTDIERDWQNRLEEINREIQLAEFQLSSLEGKDVPWFKILQSSAYDFVSGRGLTVVFVLVVAFSVWGFMRGILWLIRRRTSHSKDRTVKVHYRLASYSYRMLSGILISISVMMVLYFRQDLLLLAIMVIIFIGAALALKNLLPQYIAEGRLLLNMGGVRERERTMYNGIPWEVRSINMYSRLVNPEIRGGIRLPLSQMHDMISRPAGGDAWFPSSEGDWVLTDAESPCKVIRQSVDVVELKDLDFMTRLMPTADYYAAGYPNLSRGELFRVTVRFGIDYATQTEDVEKIETAFSEGIKQSFKGTPIEEFVLEIKTEFDSAGDSSLNYLVKARFKPEGARYHNQVKRKIQRACVMVCSENDWTIPFPQVSVHLPENNPKPAE